MRSNCVLTVNLVHRHLSSFFRGGVDCPAGPPPGSGRTLETRGETNRKNVFEAWRKHQGHPKTGLPGPPGGTGAVALTGAQEHSR